MTQLLVPKSPLCLKKLGDEAVDRNKQLLIFNQVTKLFPIDWHSHISNTLPPYILHTTATYDYDTYTNAICKQLPSWKKILSSLGWQDDQLPSCIHLFNVTLYCSLYIYITHCFWGIAPCDLYWVHLSFSYLYRYPLGRCSCIRLCNLHYTCLKCDKKVNFVSWNVCFWKVYLMLYPECIKISASIPDIGMMVLGRYF